MARRLGKLPPTHDPRTFALASYLDFAKLPTPPPTVDWSGVVTEWPMHLNDSLGCCVIAGRAHAVEEWSAANGVEVAVDDATVLAEYERVGGYRPGDPSTDGGCIMLDALNDWRHRGVAGHRLGAFAALGSAPGGVGDARWSLRLRDAVALFGCAFVGIALPACIEQQGMLWGVPSYGPRPGPRGDGTVGSLGGHCVLVTGYRMDRSRATPRRVYRAISWGQVYEFTESFADVYMDEAYVLFDRLWTDGTKPAPSGVDLVTLRADLAALAAP